MIADGFTKANVQLLASALADLILAEHGDNPTVCIGHGHRFPGGEASRWAAEALAAKEVMCHIIDRPAPMPLIMFAVRELELPFGLGITASHNPAICSGVRVFTEGGRDAAGTVTDKLEACIRAIGAQPIPVLDFEEGKARGIIDEINPRNDFIASIMVRIDLNGIKNAHLKVALDPMWGVSHTSLRTILLAARCDVHVIRDRRDPFCGDKLPAPGGDTLKALSDTVKDHQCDFGIATDGDGDRLGVVDDQGFFVHPNHLLALLSYYLLEYKGWTGWRPPMARSAMRSPSGSGIFRRRWRRRMPSSGAKPPAGLWCAATFMERTASMPRRCLRRWWRRRANRFPSSGMRSSVGSEPLLRINSEMPDPGLAEAATEAFERRIAEGMRRGPFRPRF